MKKDMSKNSTIQKKTSKAQIENHQTAAWASIEEIKPVSNVTVPNEELADDAREWVDENEK